MPATPTEYERFINIDLFSQSLYEMKERYQPKIRIKHIH